MMCLEIFFWLCSACVLYTFLLYPLLLVLLPRFRRLTEDLARPVPHSVSIVLSARNEANSVERRLDELTALLAASGMSGEIIVVSDGSTDDTARLAKQFEDPTPLPVYPQGRAAGVAVHVLELTENYGKAAALTKGCALASHEILVFGDMRQTWAKNMFEQLLKNFTDPTVGGVSGDLVVASGDGVMGGVALYWRFEKWLRKKESRVFSMVGATGAISAVRRELFRPIPAGTLNDDLYWPVQVCLQGYRVVHESHALAFDRLPERSSDEFRRKVRTLAGCYQLAVMLPVLLMPWRNPIWLQFVSHKLLRLVVPWALIGLFVSSAILPGWWYQTAFASQCFCYTLGLLGLISAARPFRLSSAAASFLVLNSASWMAFWVWISGHSKRSWGKVKYETPEKAFTSKIASVSS